MSCRLLSVLCLLFHVGGQSVDLTHHGRHLSSQWDPDFPEIDGSAVDGCGIFPVPTPETTAPPTTTPITRTQLGTAAKKPVVKSTPRKPATRSNGAPIRRQPAPSGPIPDRHSNPSLHLLYYLLTNGRQLNVGSLPFKSRLSQPMGAQRRRGQSSSESDELPSTLLNRARGAERKVWKKGLSSSDESSD